MARKLMVCCVLVIQFELYRISEWAYVIFSRNVNEECERSRKCDIQQEKVKQGSW